MMCWTNTEIAFIGQCYFIGLSLGVLNISLADMYGRKSILVKFFVPFCIGGYCLCLYTGSYLAICMGFFLIGFTRVKNTTCMVCSAESMEADKAVYSNTVLLFLDASQAALLCLFV